MSAGTCSCQQAHSTTMRAAVTEPLDAAFPVPAYPPAAWFTERPDWLTPDTDIGVDDEGRVAGYFYNAGQCLVHMPNACPQPSPTDYAAFHQQQVVTADGSTVRVGVIGNVNGHASEYARVDVAQAHYADPDRQLIVCRAFDDEHGGYILGAMVPHATYGDVALVRRSALSGDWRPMPAPWWIAHGITASVVRACEGFDCIGPTLVTRPGLPLVRRFAAAVLGGRGGVQLDETETTMADGPTTIIEAPGGVRVHVPAPQGPQPAPGAGEAIAAAVEAGTPAVVAAATEVVDAARTAADVPPEPPEGEPAASGPSPEEWQAALDRIAALEDAVTQLIDAVSEPMAATAALPPAE